MGKSVSEQIQGLKIEKTIQKTCEKFKGVLNKIIELLKKYCACVYAAESTGSETGYRIAVKIREEIVNADGALRNTISKDGILTDLKKRIMENPDLAIMTGNRDDMKQPLANLEEMIGRGFAIDGQIANGNNDISVNVANAITLVARMVIQNISIIWKGNGFRRI